MARVTTPLSLRSPWEVSPAQIVVGSVGIVSGGDGREITNRIELSLLTNLESTAASLNSLLLLSISAQAFGFLLLSEKKESGVGDGGIGN